MRQLLSPKFCSAVFLISSCISGAVAASPVVTGDTISWPDNGWYQVQRSDNYQTICEGVTSCVVDPGEYVVINHSSGERWESVTVSDPGGAAQNSNASQHSDFRINDLVIEWLVPGWFQVQDAINFNTLCESDASIPCQLTTGIYNIINLSSGRRWENVSLPAGGPSAPVAVSAPQLQSGLLTWNGSGYFQVQDANTFETLCEGSLNECTVGNRTVQLVNLTSGARWENLATTPANSTATTPTGNVAFSGGVGPVVPGLRGVVYTDSEIEIFWSSTGSGTRTVAYRIFRDGVALDTRDALSFYENNLQPGRTYQYGVAAVTADGSVGPQSFISLVTPARVDAVNAANYQQRLNYATELVNEPPSLRWIQPISDWVNTSTERPDDNFVLVSFTSGGLQNFNCSGGGSATRVSQTMSGAGVTHAVTFDACVLADGTQISGTADYEYLIVRWVGNPGGSVTLEFDLDIVDSAGREIELAGSHFNSGSHLYTIRHRIQRYSSPAFEGRTTITDYEATRKIGQFAALGLTPGNEPDPWVSQFEARFTVQSPATANRPILVSTPSILETSVADSCYETGELQVAGDDGSRLTLRPAVGSADEMEITIRSSSNQQTSQIVLWLGDGLTDVIRQPGRTLDAAPVRVWGLCGGRYLAE